MINLMKIKQVAREKKISLKELSKQVGITEQGLQNMMKKNTCNLSTLQKIAEALGVSESIFFDSPVHTNTISINTGVQGSPNAVQSVGSGSSGEVALLKSRIELLEALNQSYKEQIELLRNQILSLNNSPQ